MGEHWIFYVLCVLLVVDIVLVWTLHRVDRKIDSIRDQRIEQLERDISGVSPAIKALSSALQKRSDPNWEADDGE